MIFLFYTIVVVVVNHAVEEHCRMSIQNNIKMIITLQDIRGEGEIEKVFVLDVHCFIRKIEDFVG